MYPSFPCQRVNKLTDFHEPPYRRSQIINNINEINSEIVTQYDRDLKQEQKRKAQKDVIKR
jgi:hypothetical protein